MLNNDFDSIPIITKTVNDCVDLISKHLFKVFGLKNLMMPFTMNLPGARAAFIVAFSALGVVGLPPESSVYPPTAHAMTYQGSDRTLAQPISSSALAAEPNAAAPNHEVVPAFAQHFQDLGVDGSITIYDLRHDRWYEHNPQRNQTAFLPASTFKIPNSLIALESQAIADENTVLPWDGVQRDFPGWNRDLTMREAIKVSAVWFYQILARRVGYERMKNWIDQLEFGNRDIGQPSDINRFWLSGPLKITPREQVQFLRRLYLNQLPFSERTTAIVKDIMVVDQTPSYIVRAKTGWAMQLKPNIGWYVGYVEQGSGVYIFATNLDLPEPKLATARKVQSALINRSGQPS
jgi:beta-lactamase class D